MAQRKPSMHSLKLTKADTVALWHAVESYVLQVKCMPSMEMPDGSKLPAAEIAIERERAQHARRALRKVNAMRKAGIDPRQRSLL